MDKKVFIRELNALYGKLSDRGTKRIEEMLEKYAASTKIVEKEVVVEKVVYKEKLVIKPASTTQRFIITPQIILSTIAKDTGITVSQMRSPNRKKETVWARQLFFYFARKYTNLGYRQISQWMRGEDHSTVRHNIGEVNNAYYLHGEQIDRINNELLHHCIGDNGTLELPFGKMVVEK